MKKRVMCGVLTLTLLSVIGQAAGYKEVPLKGSGTGMITSFVPQQNGTVAITVIGSGESTLLGKFTRSEEIVLDPATGTVSGTIVFTAADGSELNCSFTGGFISATTLVGIYTFTGGTGRFDGASGTAYFSAVQLSQTDVTFEFAGAIEF